MDFWLAYDPELDASKSKGPTPLRKPPRGGSSSDPRRLLPPGLPKKGKRSGFGPKPLQPNFGEPKHAPVVQNEVKRVFVTGLDPLCTRSDVVASLHDRDVASCRLVVDPRTGASLGAACIEFVSPQAASRCIKLQKLEVGSASASVVADPTGAREQQFVAVETTAKAEQEHNTKQVEPQKLPTRSQPSQEQGIVAELPVLSREERRKWIVENVGLESMYVYVSAHWLPWYQFRASDVEQALRKQGFVPSKVAHNRQGYYCVYATKADAEACYRALNGRTLLGRKVFLMLSYTEMTPRGARLTTVSADGKVTQSHGPLAKTRTSLPSIESAADLNTEDSKDGVQSREDTLVDELRAAVSHDIHERLAAYIRELASDLGQFLSTDISESEKEPLNASGPLNLSTALRVHKKLTDKPTDTDKRRYVSQSDVMDISEEDSTEVKGSQTKASGRRDLDHHKSSPQQDEAESEDAEHKPFQEPDSESYQKYEHDLDNESDSEVNEGPKKEPKKELKEGLKESKVKPKQESNQESKQKPEEDLTEPELPWGASIGPRPVPVVPSWPTNVDLGAYLSLITSEEDFKFAREACLKQGGPGKSGFDPEAFLAHQLELEHHHHKLIPNAAWVRESQSAWRTRGFVPAVNRLAKQHWLPPQQPGELLEVVQWATDAHRVAKPTLDDDNTAGDELYTGPSVALASLQVADGASATLTGTPLPSGTPAPPGVNAQDRREQRNKDRLNAKALSAGKAAWGLNSDLFHETNLAKAAKKVKLARSAIHDWGLYAAEFIPAQDFVIEYVGETLRDEYADVRETEYEREGIDSSYLFRIDWDTICDATKRGNEARFINHSCDPNCVARIVTQEGHRRIALYAQRDVQPREELTFDYKFVAEDGEERVKCLCGTAKCRGYLV